MAFFALRHGLQRKHDSIEAGAPQGLSYLQQHQALCYLQLLGLLVLQLQRRPVAHSPGRFAHPRDLHDL